MTLEEKKEEFFYWTTNRDWWERKENGSRVIKPDAPKESQESYKHYLEQISSERGIE